jgi:hypothetical protein
MPAPSFTPSMCNPETIFEKYSRAICRDLCAKKLWRALEAHCHDGTELHGAIDRALPGLENATAAEVIKTAVKSKYANSIKIDIAIELFLAQFEAEGGGK